MEKKIKVGVVGGAGYAGGEVIRLLLNHPMVEIVFVQSSSNCGKAVTSVHVDLLGETSLDFCDTIEEVDLLFLCMGHGKSTQFLRENEISSTTKIIDLGSDFRHKGSGFTYGMVELNREMIKKSQYIANPGCFATAITLGLLPLSGALFDDIHITAITGATGAGQSLSATSHFPWREGNLSTYKNFTHQHLKEIGETINYNKELHLIPYRGDFTRGIIATIYTKTNLTIEQLYTLYRDYYKESFFTHLSTDPICLKQVVNTNKCIIALETHGDKVLITSVIDNLLKGAAGQAVENMNLIFGFENNMGLKLKPSAF